MIFPPSRFTWQEKVEASAVLDRWKRQAYDAHMSAGEFFDPVSSILRGIVSRHGMQTKMLEHRLRLGWTDIAGEQIAAHTRPDQIRFRKLYVLVDNSVWLQQLTFLKSSLLQKIQNVAGFQDEHLITDLVFRVGETANDPVSADSRASSIPRGTTAADEGSSPVPPSSEAAEQAAAHAAPVKDPDLRLKLAEVMANALARREARDRSS
ncbi:MAG: DUF721 domain-containing protein [Nitrospiraceae bacterium]